MNRRFHFLAGVAFVALVVWLIAANRTPVEARRSLPATNATETASEEDVAPEQATFQRQTREHAADLAKLEAAQNLQSQQDAQQGQALLDLQQSKAVAWSGVLATNWPAYQMLRQQAAAAPNKRTPCTLCNGRGKMTFCIVCDQSGKCLQCQGSGRISLGEPCPVCRGTGKCYLCRGTKKMPCLFCDDGVVYLKSPAPPARMPVPEFAASRTTSTRTLASAPVQESSRSSPSEEAASPVPVAPSAPSPEPTHAGTSTVLFVTVIVIGLLLLFCKFAARIAEFLNRASGQESLSRTANEIIATTRSVQPSEPVETQYATTRVGHPLTVKVDAPLTIGDWPGRNSVVGPERLASPSNRLTMPGVGKSTMGASSNSLPNLPSPTEFQAAFFANAPETLQSIQNDLAQTMGTCDLATQGDLLGSVYVNLHTLNGEADRARLRSIHRLSSALMALVKKLLENSCNITPSALNTASSALEILAVMCADRTCADLSTLVPQILVVDDDAVTRRAISASLQNAFAKPMNADSGEAAVSLADQVRFHLIFMDISMPGMDGFEACSKIHQIPLNRNTPIIFVTSHFDSSSREQAVHAGGCGYLSKPALPAELTLMAITYCFHSRLKGLKMAEQVKAAFA